MTRREARTRGAGIVAVMLIGCGGETTGVARHVDTGDAAAGGTGTGNSGGTSGRGTSSGGRSSGGSGSLVACNDGTGRTDCCPPGATDGTPCGPVGEACSRGCTAGSSSNLYCGGNGRWNAGLGLFPCGVEAGADGAVSQMSCSELETAWSSFTQGHASCTTDADCTTFLAMDASSSSCDAPPGLNRPLNNQSVDQAQPYADRYFQLACGGDEITRPNARNGLWSDFGFDGSPLMNPRCASGSCTAENLSCNPGAPPPDAGRPNDAGARD